MVCAMLNRFSDICGKRLSERLCGYIKASDRVTVIPFAFRISQIRCSDDWRDFYGSGGKFISGITETFSPYGIAAERFDVVDYFSDSREAAEEKIKSADILYFPGGLPDEMMRRLDEYELTDLIKRHGGTAVGFSAGAMAMLDKYHISPDKDYSEFKYENGLGLVGGFDIEVHFSGSAVQLESIRRVGREMGLPVYTIPDGGALIIDNGTIRCAGGACMYI